MSQKEKKRQQQQQAAQAAQAALLSSKGDAPKNAWERSPDETQAPPWKTVSKGKAPAEGEPAKGLLSPDAATTTSIPIHRRTASPDTRFSGQRTPSSSGTPAATRTTTTTTATPRTSSTSFPTLLP
jgi:type II secretory pathway pseudopilin PulG